MRADPDHDADNGDRGPQAEHHAPVEQPSKAPARAGFRAALAAAFGRARLALARRLVVFVVYFALGHGFLRLVLGSGGNAVLRRQAQFGERSAKAELRLLAAAALFPSPRHT